MRKIIYATDGSDSAQRAGEMAETFLERFPEAELIVVHVIRTTYIGDAVGFAPLPMVDVWEQMSAEIETQINEQFSRWTNRVRFISVVGTPSISICDTAREENADLIIIGSHGRGAVDRLLLGSVSNAVANRASVPVLVVK